MTSINSNPFPLGFITTTPGVPVGLTQAIPDFDSPYVNAIILQASPDNNGAIWIGNKDLNVAANSGVLYVMANGGDSWSVSSLSMNVYRIADFRIDIESPGDGVYVSVYIR